MLLITLASLERDIRTPDAHALSIEVSSGALISRRLDDNNLEVTIRFDVNKVLIYSCGLVP